MRYAYNKFIGLRRLLLGSGGGGNGGGGGTSFFTAVVQHSLETTTGNQTITATAADGWTEGETPKAAIFVFGYAETNGTAAAPLAAGFGATDGTNEAAVAGNVRHGTTGGVSKTVGARDEVIIMTDGDGDIEIRANFVEFGTDSVTVNVTAAGGGFEVPDFALVNVILLGGDDVASVTVGTQIMATQGNTVTVTTGHPNNMLFTFAPSNDLFDGAASQTARLSPGMASWDGTTVRQAGIGCTYFGEGNPHAYLNDGAVFHRAFETSTASANLENFSATAFDIRSNNADLSGVEIGYISVELANGRKAFAGVFDSPTTTGDHDFTDAAIDFTPELGMMIPSMMTVVDTGKVNAEAGSLGLSMFNGSNALCYDWSYEDTGSLSDAQSLADDQMFNVAGDDGANAFTGTFGQFLSNGARANFTAADGTTRKWIGMFVG